MEFLHLTLSSRLVSSDMISRYLGFAGQRRPRNLSSSVPFYCRNGGLVVFGCENANWSIPATPLQPHCCERAVPGEAHGFVDGPIPGAVVAVPSGD